MSVEVLPEQPEIAEHHPGRAERLISHLPHPVAHKAKEIFIDRKYRHPHPYLSPADVVSEARPVLAQMAVDAGVENMTEYVIYTVGEAITDVTDGPTAAISGSSEGGDEADAKADHKANEKHVTYLRDIGFLARTIADAIIALDRAKDLYRGTHRTLGTDSSKRNIVRFDRGRDDAKAAADKRADTLYAVEKYLLYLTPLLPEKLGKVAANALGLHILYISEQRFQTLLENSNPEEIIGKISEFLNGNARS